LSRSTAPYSTPRVLRPIELLDLLELSGTTTAVAEALGLSQPTVSRRTSHLVRDLGLRARTGLPRQTLRFADSSCLQHLRRACQAHRLEAGAWRIGSSPWQQSLLQPLQPWIAVPGRFRHPEAWRSLVASHALDGAVVSGLDLQLAMPEQPISGEHPVAWGHCLLVPISRSPLGLLTPPSAAESPERWGRVAVPAQPLAPGLASLVRQQQWQCLHAGASCPIAPPSIQLGPSTPPGPMRRFTPPATAHGWPVISPAAWVPLAMAAGPMPAKSWWPSWAPCSSAIASRSAVPWPITPPI
jgi:DNA-binding transcriptional LysR family regulator